ncbi:MAG TPA: NAD(+) synthase, partial [Vampirovibrionales bacterium]
MKIALAQINPVVGDLEGNSKKIIQVLKDTEELIDLVVFPELSLTGYPPKDLLLQPSFVQKAQTVLEKKISPQVKKACLIGLPTSTGFNSKLFNSAAFIYQHKIVKYIHKKLLPNYEVFNEARYFEAAPMNRIEDFVIELEEQKIALMICEDLLATDDETNLYTEVPAQFLKKELQNNSSSINLTICLSASPFRKGHINSRFQHAVSAAKLLNSPVVLVNQVGANDGLIFDGSSFAYDLKTNQFEKAKSFEENLIIIDTQSEDRNIETLGTSEPKDIKNKTLLEIKQALVLGIKDYFTKTGFQKAYLGLSGGIDSALVACLASEALGPNNVTAVMMPSKYSSEGSLNDSEQLLKELGIKKEKVEIENILQTYLKTLDLDQLTLAEENLQSRIRGDILMAMANSNNALVLATGNKSEYAVGYSTLYG